MIFLAFLVPLALYFLLLALVNRNQHPVMVSGTWDFAGVLFACSGFLLIGGPAILTGLYEQWRVSWVLGQPPVLHDFEAGWDFWIGVWVAYFALIVFGSV